MFDVIINLTNGLQQVLNSDQRFFKQLFEIHI